MSSGASKGLVFLTDGLDYIKRDTWTCKAKIVYLFGLLW